MKKNMSELNFLSGSSGFSVIFEALGELKNLRHRPAEIDSPCPPILFWWFAYQDESINAFIKQAVDEFPWKVDEWVLEDRGEGKWLLFPSRILIAERIDRQLPPDVYVVPTDSGVVWLMNHEPDFGRRANLELDAFKGYFKERVIKYINHKQ